MQLLELTMRGLNVWKPSDRFRKSFAKPTLSGYPHEAMKVEAEAAQLLNVVEIIGLGHGQASGPLGMI